MRPLPLLAASLVALAAGLSSCGAKTGEGEVLYANSYAGKKPPALALAGTTWLNVEGNPGLDKFLGKVVFLEFGFIH